MTGRPPPDLPDHLDDTDVGEDPAGASPRTGLVRFARMTGSSIAGRDAAFWVTDFLNAAYYRRSVDDREVDDLRLASGALTTYWYRKPDATPWASPTSAPSIAPSVTTASPPRTQFAARSIAPSCSMGRCACSATGSRRHMPTTTAAAGASPSRPPPIALPTTRRTGWPWPASGSDDPQALAGWFAALEDGLARYGEGEPRAVPEGGQPLVGFDLTTHQGHFMGNGHNRLLLFTHEGKAWVRAAGTWDAMPWHVDRMYRIAGHDAQHAFWGQGNVVAQSLLHQLALRIAA